MNKKFFAALASASMAFSATGSLAVFAQDFEDETNVVKPGDVMPVSKEVVWNKDNFGALAGIGLTGTNKDELDTTNVFKLSTTAGITEITVKDGKVKTDDLAKVTEIAFPNAFEGEIKGLEYFTGLTKFDDTTITTSDKKIKNEALDFSANTALTEIKVTKAPKLAEITLPEADEDEVYQLTTLDLEGTELTTLDVAKYENLTDLTVKNSKLNKLDLSALTEVDAVTVAGNSNLEEVTLHNGKKGRPVTVDTLDLSGNALETVNLDYITVGTTFKLENNHIGALDLSKTKVPQGAALGTQKIYVSENAKNVNLKEAIPGLKASKVTATAPAKYDSETGILTLDGKGGAYTYNTDADGATTPTLDVTLEAANPMNRLYNPNSGEHFYTADIKEKEALVALGWQDEGYGWVAPSKAAAPANSSVFRLYNPNAGDHHYTMKEDEKNTLVAYGWKDEGTGWYSAGTTDVVTVYRQYNPFANGAGSHNYTTDKAENDYLVSLGWIYEGAAWTALQ